MISCLFCANMRLQTHKTLSDTHDEALSVHASCSGVAGALDALATRRGVPDMVGGAGPELALPSDSDARGRP